MYRGPWKQGSGEGVTVGSPSGTMAKGSIGRTLSGIYEEEKLSFSVVYV